MTVCHHIIPGASTARRASLGIAIALAALAGGCANDSSNIFSTGSIAQPAAVAAPAKPDPVCVSLSSQIDAMRKDGTVDRLEKAADGKTASVKVQRTALSKQAQLNKLNADFIAKCGPAIPKAATTAAVAPAQPAAAPASAPAKTATVAPAKAKPATSESGVTVVPAATGQN